MISNSVPCVLSFVFDNQNIYIHQIRQQMSTNGNQTKQRSTNKRQTVPVSTDKVRDSDQSMLEFRVHVLIQTPWPPNLVKFTRASCVEDFKCLNENKSTRNKVKYNTKEGRFISQN